MKNLALCLVAVSSLASAACTIDVYGGEDTVVREQKRFPVTGAPHLTVRSFDGSVELRSWDRDEIVVDIERRAASEAAARALVVEATETGGDLLIEAKPPHRDGFLEHLGGPSPRVRMLITVPRRLEVEARTQDGAIMAKDLSGRINLRTGEGSVRLQSLTGNITVTTGDGAITAGDLQGSVEVRTGDGSVNLSGRLEELTARTGDGAIAVNVAPGSTMRSEWNVSTGDGSVTIVLPQGFNADIDARTGDGGISTSGVEVAGTGPQRERRGREVRGRVGQGGERLTVHTGDGAVDIHVR